MNNSVVPTSEKPTVKIVDVSARDGLQNINNPLPTEQKLQLIQALINCGIRSLEAGAFVSATKVPQMADTPQIADALAANVVADVFFLIPNLRGLELAQQHHVNNWVLTISASEKHNQANINRSIEQSIDILRSIAKQATINSKLTVSLSACWDCPFDGAMDSAHVQDIIEQIVTTLHDCRAQQCALNLADTTGKAAPDKVYALFNTVMETHPNTTIEWGLHAHNTYGLGTANAYAAWCAQVRRFEGSIAGMGGCPFAPNATGNTATEELVYLFESMGVYTNIDLKKLLKLARQMATIDGVKSNSALHHVKL